MFAVKNYLLPLLLLVFLSGCRSSRPAKTPFDKEAMPTEEPQILFLYVETFRDSASGRQGARLQNVTLNGGRLKTDYGDSVQLLPGHLLCSFLDEEGTVLKQGVVENPLRRSYEYSDEEGRLSHKIVESDSAGLFLRTRWEPNIYQLRIQSIADSGVPAVKEEIALLDIEFW